MGKKLFEVSIEITAYVMAEDDKGAREAGEDALRNENWSDNDVTAREVKTRDHAIDGGWDHNCLVWNADKDTKLGEALAELPEDPKWAKIRQIDAERKDKHVGGG